MLRYRKCHHVTSRDWKRPASDVMLPEVTWKWLQKAYKLSLGYV